MSIEGWNGPVHPAADLFPMMSEDELSSLVTSIKEQGLREPVWVTSDGALLDGRNRVVACSRAGVKPDTRVYRSDDPVAFVMALNMDRRHLTVGQKAMLALKLVPMYESETQRRESLRKSKVTVADLPQSQSVPFVPAIDKFAEMQSMVAPPNSIESLTKSRDKAGAAVKVSGRAVAQAKRVTEVAPDLAEQVSAGELALDRAERIVRDREAAARRAEQAAAQQQHIQVGTRVDVREGDFRDVLSDLSDVNAIITDPPYPKDYLPLLDDLAKWADDVLAPDGVLVVLFGQTYLPEVYQRLSGGRPYRWTGCYLTPGAGYASMPRRVQSNWKPVLVYGGGDRFADIFRSEGTDAAAKSLHHWGQDYGAFHQIVQRLTLPGQTVVDPFMGSGTTLLAAKALGRHAIGCDLDPVHVQTARQRLGV